MKIDIKNVDPVRSYWITDPMRIWLPNRRDLKCKTVYSCELSPDGSVNLSSQKVKGNKGIYLGYMLNIWGHCITDNVKKLWFLRTPQYHRLRTEGYQLFCTLHGPDKHFGKNYCQLLSMLDIDSKDICIVTETTSFEILIEPDSSIDIRTHQFHIEQKNTIDIIRSKGKIDSSLPRKIYFSRSRIHNGRDFGEKYVEEVFKKLGYTIVYPEQHSFLEQLDMLKSCDSFAATEGSISHNCMFCRKDAENIIIRKTRSCNGYQYTSNSICGGDLVYVDAHLSIFNIFDNAFGPFFMYVNDNLQNFAERRGVFVEKRFPMATFINYCMHVCWYAVRYRRPIIVIGDRDFYWRKLRQDFLCR